MEVGGSVVSLSESVIQTDHVQVNTKPLSTVERVCYAKMPMSRRDRGVLSGESDEHEKKFIALVWIHYVAPLFGKYQRKETKMC